MSTKSGEDDAIFIFTDEQNDKFAERCDARHYCDVTVS